MIKYKQLTVNQEKVDLYDITHPPLHVITSLFTLDVHPRPQILTVLGNYIGLYLIYSGI